MNIPEAYTYDDLLLVPQHQHPNVVSRQKDVDMSVRLGGYKFNHPILAANMKNVISAGMAREVVSTGGLAILHRFASSEDLKMMYNNSSPFGTVAPYNIGISLGVSQKSRESFYDIWLYAKPVIYCIDIAHGDSEACIDMIKFLRDRDPNFLIIAGNVATGQGAKRLWDAGADAVKVGIGEGSTCTTRIKTGHGIPMMSSLMDVQNYRKEWYPDRQIIADGGMRDSGDMVKALCFADMVMSGNLFARCFEAPGEIKEIDGKAYKRFEGSSTHKDKNIEGVKGWVPVSDHYQNVLINLIDGIQSGCSYAGVNNVKDLQNDPQFVKITNAGLTGSHPHDIVI